MRSVTYSLALGLLAGVATSKTFKYAIPAGIEATEGCTLPGEFEISDLTIFTDNLDSTKNVTSFHFTDVDTGIDTFCQWNSTSKSASPGTAQRWPCDNTNVEFIYQTSGIPGLTLIEKACPENPYEMRLKSVILPYLLHLIAALPFASPFGNQQTLEVQKGDLAPRGISVPFASSLERLSRLVDITYCVGTTGIKRPFICASRCKDFPALELITTWNTGVLLSDSCGYIAVDHGEPPGLDLGGAVAALAALELKVVLGWDNVVVTTFGEPRVGNEGFVNYLDAVFELNEGRKAGEKQTYRRLTHVDDPVPLLPLSEWGYRSHAGEIFISKPELPPEPSDIHLCVGDYDPNCIAGSEGETLRLARQMVEEQDRNPDPSTLFPRTWGIPSRNKPWQLFFAHRDYFWRLGLCVPGGDPNDWGRDGYGDPRLNHEL
ncbi:hypothetical protein DL768_004676 [Monosporascus sp. mg162]|nr:hypothetical protein DL768_004676 [Monosporascus sp. mg162]